MSTPISNELKSLQETKASLEASIAARSKLTFSNQAESRAHRISIQGEKQRLTEINARISQLAPKPPTSSK